MSPRVVAIDGPAASGKSTAARGVARRLGFHHLSSGLLYRAVGWAALEEGWPEPREALDGEPPPAEGASAGGPLEERVTALELELVPTDGTYRVRVRGREPGSGLKDASVAEAASRLSGRAAVRERVNRLVRAEGGRRDLVCDGRDMGTTVFPDADLKVFLAASPDERARRRLREQGRRVTPARLRREAERLRRRDERDSKRALSPLRKAADAVELDTTDLAPEEVVDRIVEEARRRGLAGEG